jgi:ATP-dependent Clp protease ATP-binding subunit ClpA
LFCYFRAIAIKEQNIYFYFYLYRGENMQENIFAGLDEAMASIIAKTTAQGFTPANLFINLLEDKNKVSEYFKEHANIKNIVLDFQKIDTTQRENTRYQKRLERVLGSIYKSTRDRYVDEVRFMTIILDDRDLSRIFMNVVGRYLDPEYVQEDINSMIPPLPNLTWEKDNNTILDTLGRNLTELAATGELSEVVDREEEIMRMIQILTRQSKSNPVLVGEAGVGNTAVVE